MANHYHKYLGPEDRLQNAVMDYIAVQYPDVLAAHIPNEGKRTPFERFKFKYLGGKAGIPDVMVFCRSGEFVGLAIELKAGKNKPTQAQNEWLEALTKNGWAAYCFNDFDDCKQTIDKYLSNKL
jgi:hypothetical protein